jgi:CMP-N-acetylneuraminic acid synthetase
LRTIAVIPARGGSRGVPGKNLLRLGGVPLLGRSIWAARHAQRVDAVFVSTDDAAIAATASRFGAGVIHRPAALSGDAASSEAALLHALDTLAAQSGTPERLVMLQCTSPFTTGEEIDHCVAALDDPPVACALSVVPDHSFLWGIGPQGFAVGTNHDETRQRPLRQTLPPQYRENGAIYAMRVAEFRQVGRRFCGPVAAIPVAPSGPEIDDLSDVTLCAALESARPAPPLPPGLAALAFDQDALPSSPGPGHAALLRQRGIHLLPLSRQGGPGTLPHAGNRPHALREALATRNLSPGQLCYVGAQEAEQDCLRLAGCAILPADAPPSLASLAHLLSARDGLAQTLDWIIEALIREPARA